MEEITAPECLLTFGRGDFILLNKTILLTWDAFNKTVLLTWDAFKKTILLTWNAFSTVRNKIQKAISNEMYFITRLCCCCCASRPGARTSM